MVDAEDLKSFGSNTVGVRVPPWAPPLAVDSLLLAVCRKKSVQFGDELVMPFERRIDFDLAPVPKRHFMVLELAVFEIVNWLDRDEVTH